MKLLIVFKQEASWNDLIISKFRLIGETHFAIARKIFQQGGSFHLGSVINNLIKKGNIDVVIFDCDFVPLIDAGIIKLICEKVIRILITFDDLVMHDLNTVNAILCDLVLSADPISVLKYLEKGINSFYMPLEGDSNVYKPLRLTKDIDVLFFGSLEKHGRKKTLDFLMANGVDVKVIGPSTQYVTLTELVKLINRSKIVLNFSQTDNIRAYDQFFPRCDCKITAPSFQFKGRIIETGLCSSVCVSEYAPAIELLFQDNEVPMFRDEAECLNIINSILRDEERRLSLEKKFHDKVMKEYEDVSRMNYLKGILNGLAMSKKTSSISKHYSYYVADSKIKQTMKNPKALLRELLYLNEVGILSFKTQAALSSSHILCKIIVGILQRELSKFAAKIANLLMNKLRV